MSNKTTTLKAIEREYNAIADSVFKLPKYAPMSYDELPQAIIRLCESINNYADEHDSEMLWYIGECTESALSDFIVGAYWHYTEWHGGQNSDSYAALCALGAIFQPGMTCPPDDDSEPEYHTFITLEEMAQGIKS